MLLMRQWSLDVKWSAIFLCDLPSIQNCRRGHLFRLAVTVSKVYNRVVVSRNSTRFSYRIRPCVDPNSTVGFSFSPKVL